MGHYYYYEAPRKSSIFDGLTLSPLPYPVLVILALICIFLGISSYSSYEDAVETADASIKWLLLGIPITIIFVLKWLDSNRQRYYCGPLPPPPPPSPGRVGVSPWGAAALIIFLLVFIHTNPSS